jgi:hypothetical protein
MCQCRGNCCCCRRRTPDDRIRDAQDHGSADDMHRLAERLRREGHWQASDRAYDKMWTKHFAEERARGRW